MTTSLNKFPKDSRFQPIIEPISLEVFSWTESGTKTGKISTIISLFYFRKNQKGFLLLLPNSFPSSHFHSIMHFNSKNPKKLLNLRPFVFVPLCSPTMSGLLGIGYWWIRGISYHMLTLMEDIPADL
jgi:hypothetical protein